MKTVSTKIRMAIEAALNAALAGDGFDGGDFDSLNRDDFEAALKWIGTHKPRKRPVKRQRPDYEAQARYDAEHGEALEPWWFNQ
jgi:hypothetical protein